MFDITNGEDFIHPTSIVGKDVKIGRGVYIGPFCHIDGDITIGDGCKLHSHVCIYSGFGKTTIGKNNSFFSFTSIGNLPQDLKFKNESSFLEIGDNNIFRETVTIHLGTEVGGFLTKIGSNNVIAA